MSKDHGIKMGMLCKDEVTGFKGVVTGIATHLYNCDTIGINSRDITDGKPAQSVWFDCVQIQIIDKEILISIAEPVKHNIILGDFVKDTLSGLEGVVVDIAIWSNGCVRLGVQPRTLKDGHPVDSFYIPVQQVVVVSKKIEPTVKPPGGPMKTPVGQKAPK